MNQTERSPIEAMDTEALRAEVRRLTALVEHLQKDRAALFAENLRLKATQRAPEPPAPVIPTVVNSGMPKTRGMMQHDPVSTGPEALPESDLLLRRKVQLENDLDSAKKVIYDAAAIRSQLDELERMTDTLCKENRELRAGMGMHDPAAPLAPPNEQTQVGYQGLSMIRQPRRLVVEPPLPRGMVAPAAFPPADLPPAVIPSALRLNTPQKPQESTSQEPEAQRKGNLSSAFFRAFRKK